MLILLLHFDDLNICLREFEDNTFNEIIKLKLYVDILILIFP